MGDKRSGLGGVVREALEEGEPLLEDADQLDLLGDDPERGSPVGGSLFAQGKGVSPVVRQVGRPQGAQNLTTKRMRDYLLAHYRHPLLGIFDIASTPPDQIAQLILPRDADGNVETYESGNGENATTRKFAVSKDDLKWALDFWKQCVFEAAEYVATKQPRQVIQDTPLPPVLQVYMGAPSAAMGEVIQGEMGLPKDPMLSRLSDEDAAEVPQEEVPQDGQSVANTTDPEPSGD